MQNDVDQKKRNLTVPSTKFYQIVLMNQRAFSIYEMKIN